MENRENSSPDVDEDDTFCPKRPKGRQTQEYDRGQSMLSMSRSNLHAVSSSMFWELNYVPFAAVCYAVFRVSNKTPRDGDVRHHQRNAPHPYARSEVSSHPHNLLRLHLQILSMRSILHIHMLDIYVCIWVSAVRVVICSPVRYAFGLTMPENLTVPRGGDRQYIHASRWCFPVWNITQWVFDSARNKYTNARAIEGGGFYCKFIALNMFLVRRCNIWLSTYQIYHLATFWVLKTTATKWKQTNWVEEKKDIILMILMLLLYCD